MGAENFIAYFANEPAVLPDMIELEAVAQQLIALYNVSTGATYSLYFGSIGRQNLYAVSIYPERSDLVSGKFLSANMMRTFLRKNLDLLREPRHAIGVWYDAENDLTFLDVSVVLVDKETAMRLGREYNQISIFDFEHHSVIDTDGTGEEIENLPPIDQRLFVWEQTSNEPNDNSDSLDDST